MTTQSLLFVDDPIAVAIGRYAPELATVATRDRAAVALVLRDAAAGADVLFIERAVHPEDPWSGQMAFPGGRVDAEDASPRHAAERETLEELGIDLRRARFLGQIDDKEGRPTDLIVSCFVYGLRETTPLRLNYEVAAALWVPVTELLDRDRTAPYPHPRNRGTMVPGIRVGADSRHTVWGLTHRFLTNFFEVLGQRLPGVD